MNNIPKVSILIPYHDMKDAGFFLKRNIDSIMMQTFKDYEIVLTKNGKMAENSNSGIKRARGEIIKMLYLDDYFAHPEALEVIVNNFKGGWLATGCQHDNGKDIIMPHYAKFEGIPEGINNIGSPSVVAFENKDPLMFDEEMSWFLDVDLYKRLGERYGPPTIVDDLNIVIGIGGHQMTRILTDDEKIKEQILFQNKYA